MVANNSPFFGNAARVSTNRLDGSTKDTGGSYTPDNKSTGSGALDKIKAIANNALNPANQDTGNPMNQPDAPDVGNGVNQPGEPAVGNGLNPPAEQHTGSPWSSPILIELGLSVSGSVSSDGDLDQADDQISGYHYIQADAGEQLTITGERQENDYDMYMWLFRDYMTYQDFRDSGTLDNNELFLTNTINYIGNYDDQIDRVGPYGDPLAAVNAPDSGFLTVVVTNFASGDNDGGDGRFDYQLDLVGDGQFVEKQLGFDANDIGLIGCPFWACDDIVQDPGLML
jgi:hypothetical protein